MAYTLTVAAPSAIVLVETFCQWQCQAFEFVSGDGAELSRLRSPLVEPHPPPRTTCPPEQLHEKSAPAPGPSGQAADHT
ncbi:MAG TPA: hypothetical protein VND92_06665 [Vicinamibacterales bacterium]|nr:hypothetical protein [Vicinamibacterales bacterium]